MLSLIGFLFPPPGSTRARQACDVRRVDFFCAMVSKASHQVPFLLPAAQCSSAVAPGSGTLSPVTGMTPDLAIPHPLQDCVPTAPLSSPIACAELVCR